MNEQEYQIIKNYLQEQQQQYRKYINGKEYALDCQREYAQDGIKRMTSLICALDTKFALTKKGA